MRKIIVYIATSVDGFIARRDGGIDWLDRPRPRGNYGMDRFYRSLLSRWCRAPSLWRTTAVSALE